MGENLGIAKVLGAGVGLRFKVQFLGAGQIAAERASAFLEWSCKDDEGKWEEISVPDPSKSLVRVYFAPDASPKQEKLEKLSNLLEENYQKGVA